jgi:hypothetical protein
LGRIGNVATPFWLCGGICIAASLAFLWILEGQALRALMCWIQRSRSSER